ncbi:MAG: hypothetical protein IKP10_06890 [Clostridia bacterium]|nr:hypothetical protein [Clostridia bacterium]
MTLVELLEKAEREGKKVRLVLTDGLALDSVGIVDCTSYDDIELDIPQEKIDEIMKNGRDHICIIDWDEIQSAELLDE